MGPRQFCQDQDKDQDTKPQDQSFNPQDRGQDQESWTQIFAEFVSLCPIYLGMKSTQFKDYVVIAWLLYIAMF